MASRTEHAAAAEKALSNVKPGLEVDVAMVVIEVAKVQATLALAAAITEAAHDIANNLYKIRGFG